MAYNKEAAKINKLFKKEETSSKVCPHCGGLMHLKECQSHKSALYVTEILDALDDIDPKVLEKIEEFGDGNKILKITEQRFFCSRCPLASGIAIVN